MTLPHVVIIAGGRGMRLGVVRKADLRLGGVRQLDRVISALGKIVSPIMVASGPP
jgi:molybdopterin-guanine dinucleotide biosynthesis protein A